MENVVYIVGLIIILVVLVILVLIQRGMIIELEEEVMNLKIKISEKRGR